MQTAPLIALALLFQSSTQEPTRAPAAQSTATQRSKPLRVSGGVMSGLIAYRVWPTYPPEAKKQLVSGAVVVHVVIDEKGKVAEITPVSGPEILRQPCMDAVRQWRYKPYMLNGRPTPVETTVTIRIDVGA